MRSKTWRTVNPSGSKRVIVTKELPGDRWLEILTGADCRIEICTSSDVLSAVEIKSAIGDRCDGAIGQLTENWGEELFSTLKKAGGSVYSNYAVGFDNVDIDAATKHGIPVGNTPGVLTETTAEMAVALTFAAARRVNEAEHYLRAGSFSGWLPSLFLGELMHGRTLGIIGAGRIGSAYARMMVEGHKMNLVYYSLHQKKDLESFILDYGEFLKRRGQEPVSCQRAESIETLLKISDCISIHTILDTTTRHLINADRLSMMKENAILINTARGPIIDEAALVSHCRNHPNFRVGLDVFENEPAMSPGLVDLDNVVIVPHIGSATRWTRQGMAILAALNVSGILSNFPVWNQSDMMPFLVHEPPRAVPSIVNATQLNI